MEAEVIQATEVKKKSLVFPIIFGVAILGAVIFGFKKYNYAQHYEDTDDAQVEGNISPVLPRIAGYVVELPIKDNEQVKKGQILLKLDDNDLKIKVQQAQAALDNALANVEVIKANAVSAGANTATAGANIQTAASNLQAAKVKLNKVSLDYTRYEKLLADKSITQQLFDNAKAEKETAQVQVEAAESQLDAIRKQKNATQMQQGAAHEQIAVAESIVKQRQADLDFAKLQLSYATITAPADGYVSKKSIQPGQFLQAGQLLFSIVGNGDVWVTANFKETQLEKMKVGQTVTVELDAYPDLAFQGKVESIAAATGARFALLPPDNASGNFVKVVQRVPVKIVIDQQETEHPLRAGMNVKVVVNLN
ncbi:MAG: HlyD family secretion protein [Bacteroidota bacterium]